VASQEGLSSTELVVTYVNHKKEWKNNSFTCIGNDTCIVIKKSLALDFLLNTFK
jgi:hypothetical protein